MIVGGIAVFAATIEYAVEHAERIGQPPPQQFAMHLAAHFAIGHKLAGVTTLQQQQVGIGKQMFEADRWLELPDLYLEPGPVVGGDERILQERIVRGRDRSPRPEIRSEEHT